MAKKHKVSRDLAYSELAYLLPLLDPNSGSITSLPSSADKRGALLMQAQAFCSQRFEKEKKNDIFFDESSMAHYLRWYEKMSKETSRSMLHDMVRTLSREEQVMLIQFLVSQI